MKKLFVIVLAMLTVFCFTACGKTEEPVTESAPEILTEQESENAIGFDICNMKATFDAEGSLLTLDRYYVVWQ